LIVDYDNDDENDGWQSDIVSIALNLAFIKDCATLKELVKFGDKGRMEGTGLILAPTVDKVSELPDYAVLIDNDLEEKERMAEEKEKKRAKAKAKRERKAKKLA